MNHIEHTDETIDQDLVIEYAENLIKEHKDALTLPTRKSAISSASITSQKLAQETAKKFYYETTRYLMELNE